MTSLNCSTSSPLLRGTAFRPGSRTQFRDATGAESAIKKLEEN